MYTLKDCVAIATEINGEKPDLCREYDNFYLFNSSKKGFTGTIFLSVNKHTGKADFYDITANPKAFMLSKVIKI